MEHNRLPSGLALRQRVRPQRAAAELRQRATLYRGWRFAVAAAAVILVWLSLSLTVAWRRTRLPRTANWNPSVVGMAKQLRQISPELLSRGIVAGGRLLHTRRRDAVADERLGSGVRRSCGGAKGANAGETAQDGPRQDYPPPGCRRPADSRRRSRRWHVLHHRERVYLRRFKGREGGDWSIFRPISLILTNAMMGFVPR